PLISAEGDSFRLSFGAELARIYLGIAHDSVTVTRAALIFNQKHAIVRRIPLDDAGQLYLNPFGTSQNLKAISLVELLQTFSKNPDSLQFRDKLIFLAVTAPGIAFLKTTPLTNVLPAALLHLTVAENIIFQNYLYPVKFIWAACLSFLLCLLIWLGVAIEKNEKIIGLKSLGILGAYWLIAVLLFIAARLVLPLFYPTLLGASVLVFSVLYYLRQRQQIADLQKVQLFKEIQQKQAKLTATEGLLQNLQTEIARTTQENVALNQQRQAEITTLNSQIQTLQQEIADLEIFPLSEPEPGPLPESDIIYAPHSKMQSVLALIEKIRQDDIPVLILGETGTGKEMIARTIHQTSSRHRNHFIAINCGALPETLLESELFGHEKGSYTGAVAPRRGRFELADGGTLFLDEITETSPNFQAKLLRVLQEGTFERLGSEKTLSVSVRIIAASNQNLSDQVEAGKFRVDLFYRLNGFPIQLPPLRERVEDIPLLSRHFLKKHGYQTIQNFSSAAMALLLKYPWPGNVRELENAVRRAAILARSENRRIIQIQHLPLDIRDFQPVTVVPAYLTLEDQILAALRQRQFSHTAIQETATALGNRDRGTITEYFRGICFQYLVENQFDHAAAARQLAGVDNVEIVSRVQKKLEAYLKHLKSRTAPSVPGEIAESPAFKGLPQKYHPYLIQILDQLKSAD
ncbi:sigma 54-interacting transcriptional regulator, partial [candidate division KSB1 bacterium]|nr:sigma 54-interacting transcriptional regulator [candidate division KSB1 bacterium]